MPEQETVKTKAVKPKSRWFQKIPKDVLFSPAGVVLIAFAFIIELIDLIPLPLLDNLWELPLEIAFVIALTLLAKVPIKSSIIPLLVERIPIINDFFPTWVVRMFF